MIAQQILNGIVVGAVYALFSLGLTLVYGLYRMADWSERRGKPRTSRFAAMASWLAGK